MLEFIFDRLANRENLCGHKEIEKEIVKLIKGKQNIVIYGPRNYGKTSLVKNIIIPDFKEREKRSFVLFADLMGAKDMFSLENRLKRAFEISFKNSFPVQNIIENIKEFLSSYQAEFNLDLENNQPSFKLGKGPNNEHFSLEDIFTMISKIAQKIPCLIVLDEFQDISLIPEAEARLRDIFQNLGKIPIIVLGSKKHLLSNIFVKPDAPLANWGNDIVLKPIEYAIFTDYINLRFAANNLHISSENSIYLQNSLNRVPEAINLVCYEINHSYNNTEINKEIIGETLLKILSVRQARFESYLLHKSKAEEEVLTALARHESIDQPTSKLFVRSLDLTAKSISKNISKLMDEGTIEYENGYRLSDPLLKLYLQNYR